MMHSIFISLLFVLVSHARADDVLPPDVPKVRFSVDPFYHEQGFRVGHILSYARDIFWNYEGQLMLGSGSSPTLIFDRWCLDHNMPSATDIKDAVQKAAAVAGVNKKCTIDTNPWSFSAMDPKLFQQYNNSGQGSVVVFYEKEATRVEEFLSTGSKAALWTDTRNYVSRLWRTDDSLEIPSAYPSEKDGLPWSDLLPHESVTTEGRIVKATMDGTYLKTYEITIQEGYLGTNFKRLSVTDKNMFDYMVATMLADRKVRITFVDLFAIETGWERVYPGYTSPYRVLRVQAL